MNKLVAIGLISCLPTGLAAENPAEPEFLPIFVNVMVIEDAAPVVKDVMCAQAAGRETPDCLTMHRAVLSARMQKVSVRERGRWM